VVTTSPVADVGEWCMVTAVRVDTRTVLIYKNGVLQNTFGSFTNPASCSSNLLFGDNFSGNQYDGDLGVIRIYNRPLSASDINAIYVADTP
jgi:hypothetical protein